MEAIMRIAAIFFCVILALTLFGISGCEGEKGDPGPVGPAGPSVLSIVGALAVGNPAAGVVDVDAVVSITGAPSIPDVRINEHDMQPDGIWLLAGGRLGYVRTFSLNEADSAHLVVDYTKVDSIPGMAEATIYLPGYFSPVLSNIEVDVGEDVVVEWGSSPRADAYWLYFNFDYNYFDTGGSFHSTNVQFDTVVPETTFTVPGSDIFPSLDEIDMTVYFDGDIEMRAVTGSWLPGEVGNITGDGVGFFVATTMARVVDVDLSIQLRSSKPSLAAEENENSRDDGLERMLRKFEERLIR
jgi:hypothetical protein